MKEACLWVSLRFVPGKLGFCHATIGPVLAMELRYKISVFEKTEKADTTSTARGQACESWVSRDG